MMDEATRELVERRLEHENGKAHAFYRGRSIHTSQEVHHKKYGFDAEFLALLKKHEMEFDPKFVFG